MHESIDFQRAASMTPALDDDFDDDLLDFLDEARSPWHACQAMAWRLMEAGFVELDEAEEWPDNDIPAYVRRNGSSLIAFAGDRKADSGLRMVGAHTDSPGLRLKPQADVTRHGYRQWSVEVYGGALLRPWFDRELALAGRVVVRDADGRHHTLLIDLREPIAIIPSLAIHLDRDANKGAEVNAQRQLMPMIGMAGDAWSLEERLREVIDSQYGITASKLVGHELFLVDHQPPGPVGIDGQWLASARLDNLLSCYVGMQALIASADGDSGRVFIATDHEEVGSRSACGADGPFLRDVLQRRYGDDLLRLLRRSSLVSADNAHALHPNYADKHDPDHAPMLGGGPVIKHNANQRYASNAETVALFQSLADALEVPVQHMAMRADMACGSTIGPITASGIGIATVDVGIPQLAMHSPRELASFHDCRSMARVLGGYYLT